jgi:hypothetical protein
MERFSPQSGSIGKLLPGVENMLRLHGKVDEINSKTCTIWLAEDGRVISEKLSGVRLLDISAFFMRHQSLMLDRPYDFTGWLATTGQEESVRVCGDPSAYRKLGFSFDAR